MLLAKMLAGPVLKRKLSPESASYPTTQEGQAIMRIASWPRDFRRSMFLCVCYMAVHRMCSANCHGPTSPGHGLHARGARARTTMQLLN